MRRILLQLDSDAQPSVFDSVVAIDSDVDFLLRHGGVTPETVTGLVHGAMFTRGPEDLWHTAIFIGGSDVAAGDALLEEVKKAFFGPMRVSVLADPNGSNTTAAAAVIAARKHLTLSGTTALVLGGTGPVGQRVGRLLAKEGAAVRLASRSEERAGAAAEAIRAAVPGADIHGCVQSDAPEALEGVELVISAGAAGVTLLSQSSWQGASALRVLIDLNAVPPAGIEGVEVTDKAKERNGVVCYGAIGVGGTKMKLHRRAIRKLFESNDQILNTDEVYALADEIGVDR